MKKQYIIQKAASEKEIDFSKIPALNIHNCLWDKFGYAPVSMGQFCYTDEALYVKLTSYETEITGRYTQMNDPVYTDSCLEFFISPNYDTDKRYMNFETNCLGALLLGLGTTNENREDLTVDFKKEFGLTSTVSLKNIKDYQENHWSVCYHIPFSFLEKYFGPIHITSGKKIAANVFKCGDETKYEHYMSWNKVDNEVPNFHLSEFFGEMIFE